MPMPLIRAALLIILVAANVRAEEQTPVGADVTLPCAATSICAVTQNLTEHASFYRQHYRQNLREKWIDTHANELLPSFHALCRQAANCFAIPGNRFQFCNDAIVPDARKLCDRYAADSDDREQCGFLIESLVGALDRQSLAEWKTAQECSKPRLAEFTGMQVPPVVRIEPQTIPATYTGTIHIYTWDAATRLPLDGRVTIGDQVIYAKANPSGYLATWYPFSSPIKLVRSRRADGHDDLVAPTVRIDFEHFPDLTFPLPMDLPQLDVTVTPDPATLKPGKHLVTVWTTDRATGKPVEMRVMAGQSVLGESNRPIELLIEKRVKRPEIWVTSLFDAYSDVVVAPAVK